MDKLSGLSAVGHSHSQLLCVLFAEYFAFLKEEPTQAWNNEKNSSERKGRSETDDSQFYHPTLFQDPK